MPELIGVPLQWESRHTVRGGFFSQVLSVGTFLLGFVRIGLVASLVVLGTHTWATSDVLFARARDSFSDLKDNFHNISSIDDSDLALPMASALVNATMLTCRMLAMVLLCIEATVRVKRPFGEEIGPEFSILRMTRLPFLLTCSLLLFVASSADSQAEFSDNNRIERELGHTYDLITRKARTELGIYDVFLLARVIVFGLGVLGFLLSLRRDNRRPHTDFIRANTRYTCKKCSKRAYFAKHTYEIPKYCNEHRPGRTIETTPRYSWMARRYYDDDEEKASHSRGAIILRIARLLCVSSAGVYASYMYIHAMDSTEAPPLEGEEALADLGWHPDDTYVATFRSTGCCRTDLGTSRWQGREDNFIFQDMYDLCLDAARFNAGWSTKVVEHEICACGTEVPVCSQQSVFASTRATDSYAFTFQATGCCNASPTVDVWKAQRNQNVLTEMFTICEANRLGTASEAQTSQCGCGDTPPSSCVEQTRFTAVWSVFLGHLAGALVSLIAAFLVLYRGVAKDRLHTFEVGLNFYVMIAARYLHAVDSALWLRMFPIFWFGIVVALYLIESIVTRTIFTELVGNASDLGTWIVVLLPHFSLLAALAIGTGGVLILVFAVQAETSVVIFGGLGFVLFGMLVGSFLDRAARPPLPETFRKELIAAQGRNVNFLGRVLELKIWQFIYPAALLCLMVGPTLIYTGYDANLIDATVDFDTTDVQDFVRQVQRLDDTAGEVIGAFVQIARMLNPCLNDPSQKVNNAADNDVNLSNGGQDMWGQMWYVTEKATNENENRGLDMGFCISGSVIIDGSNCDTETGSWYYRGSRQALDCLWVPEELSPTSNPPNAHQQLVDCQTNHRFAHNNTDQFSADRATDNEQTFRGNRCAKLNEDCGTSYAARTWNPKYVDPNGANGATISERCSGVSVFKDNDAADKTDRDRQRCFTLAMDPPSCRGSFANGQYRYTEGEGNEFCKETYGSHAKSGWASKCVLADGSWRCTYPKLDFIASLYGTRKSTGLPIGAVANTCPSPVDANALTPQETQCENLSSRVDSTNTNDKKPEQTCRELQKNMNRLTRDNLAKARAALQRALSIAASNSPAGNTESVQTGLTTDERNDKTGDYADGNSRAVLIPTYNQDCLNTACVATGATIIGAFAAGVIAKVACTVLDLLGLVVVIGPFDFPGGACATISDVGQKIITMATRVVKMIYKFGKKLIRGVKTMVKKRMTIKNAKKSMKAVAALGGSGGKAIRLTQTALTGLVPFFGIGTTAVLLAVWSRETVATNTASLLFAAVNICVCVACSSMLFTLFGFGGLFGSLGGITDQGFLVWMVNYILEPLNIPGRMTAVIYVTDDADPFEWGLRITAVGSAVMALYCGLDYASRRSNDVPLAKDGTTVSRYDGGIRTVALHHPHIHRRRIGNRNAKIGAPAGDAEDMEKQALLKLDSSDVDPYKNEDNVMRGYEIGTTLGGWLIACLFCVRPVMLGYKALAEEQSLFDITMAVTPDTASAILGIVGGDVMRGGSNLGSMDMDDVNCDLTPVGLVFKSILLPKLRIPLPSVDLPNIGGFDELKAFWSDIFDDFTELGEVFGKLIQQLRDNIGNLEGFDINIDLSIPNIPIPFPLKFFWYVDWLLVWGVPTAIVALIGIGTILSVTMSTTRKNGPGQVGAARRMTLSLIRHAIIPLGSIALVQAFFLVAVAAAFSADFDAVLFSYESGAGPSTTSAIEACFWLLTAGFTLHVNALNPVNG